MKVDEDQVRVEKELREEVKVKEDGLAKDETWLVSLGENGIGDDGDDEVDDGEDDGDDDDDEDVGDDEDGRDTWVL